MNTQPGSQLKILGLTMCAGGLGGLVPLVLQALGLGTKLFNIPWYAAVPASLFLGAVAGVIGILLGNSDTSDATQLNHTLAFALACGIFWQPTINGASTQVRQSVALFSARELRAKSQSLAASAVAKPAPAQNIVASKITDTSGTATSLIEQIPNIGDAELRAELLTDSKNAVFTIGNASSIAPQEGVDSLRKLGLSAVKTNQAPLADNVLSSLKQIGEKDTSVAAYAAQASAVITSAAQKKNLSVVWPPAQMPLPKPPK